MYLMESKETEVFIGNAFEFQSYAASLPSQEVRQTKDNKLGNSTKPEKESQPKPRLHAY